MCKRCGQLNQREKAQAERKNRISRIKIALYDMLIADQVKGSEYHRLVQMTGSPDEENLTVVEGIIEATSQLQLQL